MKKRTIAITTRDNSFVWSNGINQNAYFLYKLLEKAGYEPSLVCLLKNNKTDNIGGIPLKHLNISNCTKYDVIIQVVNMIDELMAAHYVQQGGKLVSIRYGNKLLVDIETILFADAPKDCASTDTPGAGHQMWISPHYEFQIDYLRTLSRTDVKVCPYIWGPEIFEARAKELKLSPYFNEKTTVGNIGVFEPNLNIVKTSLIPMVIAENLYRKKPELIRHTYLFSAKKIVENKRFSSIAKSFDIYHDGKLTFEERYHTPFVLSKNLVGTCVSHQFENQLNYLQLEMLYCGVPIVHNSPWFKDHGYYYDYFDDDAGSKALELALETHKDTFKEKRQKDRARLEDFSPYNPKNIERYTELIESLF